MNRLELIKQGIENLSEEDFNKRFGDLITKEKYFVPKVGEEYFYPFSNGIIKNCVNDKSQLDEMIIKNNKLFKTKKEAEHHRDKQHFLLKMERDFLDNSDEIDWGDDDQNKYYFYIDHDTKLIEISFNFSHDHGVLFTTNLYWLKQYIKDNAADIKKYYFDIKENK